MLINIRVCPFNSGIVLDIDTIESTNPDKK